MRRYRRKPIVERDLVFFLFGAWSVLVLQSLL
jgi:hypothetical protein